MLTNLSVKNFKSWRDLPNMEFGKVTALFGPNNSGKTSLIKLLLMLKQTVESRDRTLLNLGGDPQDYVNLGNYAETVYLHEIARKIEVGIEWKPLEEKKTSFLSYGLVSRWRYQNNLITQEFISQKAIKPNKFRILAESIYLGDARGEFDITLIVGEKSENFHTVHQHKRWLFKTPFYELSLRGGMPHIPEDLDRLKELKENIESDFPALFNRTFYLGPIRAQPKRVYQWSGEGVNNVGVLGEYTFEALLTQGQKVYAYGGTPFTGVNHWLNRLGVANRFDINKISDNLNLFEVRIHTDASNNYANLADVGFGVSQVLPIVALAYLAPPESIIILEQPELHLHPKVQAELADLFLEAAQTRNIQFIIESHSEHLLARLQRRLAERSGVNEHLTENDVKLYFCQREGSESTLQPLQLDQYGRIQNWPPDFFGDLLDERLKAMEAMAFRQHKAQTNGQAAQ